VNTHRQAGEEKIKIELTPFSFSGRYVSKNITKQEVKLY